jgi:DNA-binding IclR family transcriptional regulator
MTWNSERAVLGWLDDHPAGGTAGQIAQDLQLSGGTVSMVLRRLQTEGFAVKDASHHPVWRKAVPERDAP